MDPNVRLKTFTLLCTGCLTLSKASCLKFLILRAEIIMVFTFKSICKD